MGDGRKIGGGERATLRYRWVVWGVMSLAYMVVFFHRLAAGVVRDDLIAAFGLSSTAFGHLAATYSYAYLLMQIPVGLLADTLGARLTVTFGMVLAGVGSLLFGYAPNAFWLFAGRFVVGVGVSTVFVCILKILSRWYRENEFATMSGLTNSIGNLGGYLAQTPLAILVVAITWRHTFGAIGILSFALAAACYVFVRNRPESMGLPSLGTAKTKEELPSGNLLAGVMEIIRYPLMWPGLFFVPLFMGAALAVTGAWGVPFLQDVYGMAPRQASGIVSAAVIGSILGGLVLGSLSDRLGRRKPPMITAGIVYVICWGILVFFTSRPVSGAVMRALFFCQGFSSMAFVIALTITKEINHPEKTGIAIALLNMTTFMGIALFPPLMGAVMDLSAGLPAWVGYRRAFMTCLVSAVIGLALASRMKETRCRNIYFEIRRGGN
ncbi:MAG TPA: MFS transporter [Synergistaceae bacterium]|nr:MFS transporter [Synergistaceae bacterium]